MESVTQGSQASASQVNSCLNAIEVIGTNTLNILSDFQELTLIQYQNSQSYINSKRVLANRISGPNVPITISAGDFACIDQGASTASLRGDSGNCTNRETLVEFNTFTNFNFTSNVGQVSSLDTAGQLFQVVSSTIPTGQFNLQMPSVISANLVVFDILASPGIPVINVSVSPDGVNYIPFTSISVNGYRISASGPSTDTNYIRITITPSAPDLLNGTTYSFGITSLNTRGSTFALRSQFSSRTMTFTPSSATLYFGTTYTSQVAYYVSLSANNTTSFIQYPANSTIPIPGAGTIASTLVGLTANSSNFGVFGITLNSGVYPQSLSVVETTDGTNTGMMVVPNLSVTDPNITTIVNEYVCISAGSLILVTSKPLTGRTFNVTYDWGPSTMNLILKVILNSTNPGSTATFGQAYFEAV